MGETNEGLDFKTCLKLLTMELKILLQILSRFKELRTRKQRRKTTNHSSIFINTVDNKVFEKIADANSWKEASDTLVKYFKHYDKVKKKIRQQALRRQYEL